MVLIEIKSVAWYYAPWFPETLQKNTYMHRYEIDNNEMRENKHTYVLVCALCIRITMIWHSNNRNENENILRIQWKILTKFIPVMLSVWFYEFAMAFGNVFHFINRANLINVFSHLFHAKIFRLKLFRTKLFRVKLFLVKLFRAKLFKEKSFRVILWT